MKITAKRIFMHVALFSAACGAVAFEDRITETARALEFIPPPTRAEMIETAVKFVNHPKIRRELVEALIEIESTGNAEANAFNEREMPANGSTMDRTALASAHGLMQVLGKTAVAYGYHWSALYDEQTNILIGTQYFASCLERFGSEVVAVKCYHGGPNKKQWGPKTAAHADKFLRALGAAYLKRG